MKLPLHIARRYLFAKKSHNAINIISMVSVCGVAVCTLALICVLSVLNGFQQFYASLFTNFDPELKILPAKGKVFDIENDTIKVALSSPEISMYSGVIEENAMVKYNDRQVFVSLKGVNADYGKLVTIDSLIIDGRFVLAEGDVNYSVLGFNLAISLGLNVGFVAPLEIYVPKRDERINVVNALSSVNMEHVFAGGVFRANTMLDNENFLIIPIELARTLYNYETEVSAVDLRLAESENAEKVKKKLSTILGENYLVQDRYEQKKEVFRMISIEKWMSFLILTFVLALALFNLVGSLSMLMIDKKEDVNTLRSLGANSQVIQQIFFFEGWIITAIGAFVGLVIGIVLCWGQMYFGWIKLGYTEGAFLTDVYPVQLQFSDVVVTICTVLFAGFITSYYTVKSLGKSWLKKA